MSLEYYWSKKHDRPNGGGGGIRPRYGSRLSTKPAIKFGEYILLFLVQTRKSKLRLTTLFSVDREWTKFGPEFLVTWRPVRD